MTMVPVLDSWCRIHRIIQYMPAMEAEITDTIYDMGWLVGLMDRYD